MGKKRYWHRKQLELTGNALPNTVGRRRPSKEIDPWKLSAMGFLSYWISAVFNRLSTVIVAPKIKKTPCEVNEEGSCGDKCDRIPILEIRLRELCVLIVIVNVASLVIVSTEFVPDEYWQSTEVAHKHVFGQGHLTWEWKYGLRSYLFPMLHMAYYEVLKFCSLDSPITMIYGSRLMNCMLMIVGEFYFFMYGAICHGFLSSLYSLILMLSSWFVFYCSSRIITNTTETALNMIALFYFESGKLKAFTTVLAINFSIRPTAIIPWFPQLIVILSKKPTKAIICACLGISVLCVLAVIDSFMYGYGVLPLWNFVDFNFLKGQSAEFGTHSFAWYFYSALPSILLLDTFTFFEIVYKARNLPRYFLKMTSIATFFAFFSLVGHKEIRFVLPILPFIYSIMGDYHFENVKLNNLKKKISDYRFFTKSMWISLAVHLMVALYFSTDHQAAIRPATQFINTHAAHNHNIHPNIWILMPCYSVPVHTYMHNVNANFEYFTCAPSKLGMEDKMSNFQAGSFAEINLSDFFKEKLGDGGDGQSSADYILLFSGISYKVQSLAQSYHLTYNKCFTMSHVRMDETLHPKHVHVLCREPKENSDF